LGEEKASGVRQMQSSGVRCELARLLKAFFRRNKLMTVRSVESPLEELIGRITIGGGLSCYSRLDASQNVLKSWSGKETKKRGVGSEIGPSPLNKLLCIGSNGSRGEESKELKLVEWQVGPICIRAWLWGGRSLPQTWLARCK